MKLYHVYKKLFSTVLIIVIILAPLAILNAESVVDLQNQINQKNSDIDSLEKEIAAFQAELDTLGKEKNSLNKSIKELDLTKKKLTIDIAVTQKKIDKTNLTIAGLTSDISDKQATINTEVQAVSLGIKNVNEFEQSNIVSTLLSEGNFTQMWNDLDDIATIQESVRKDIIELKQLKGSLEDTKEVTVKAKNELTALKSKLADQQKIVIQNAKEKSKLLAQTKNSEANYQKLLKEQLAKKEAFERELRNYETQLQFILDPSKLPKAGVLSWPLDSIFVTQQFGAKTGPHRTYANGHNGTDFRARTPLPVKSMADGVVKGIGDTDVSCPGVSFGKFIFIEYDNGLSSTFGHLSLIKVQEGQRVSRGEVVGYTGGTGRVTGPHLHVSLYVSRGVKMDTLPSKSCPGRILRQPIAAINAYLDPMYYLLP